MKTAMQLAVESYKNDGVSFTDWFINNYEMLLQKEKDEMIKAHVNGANAYVFDGIITVIGYENALDYYNQTYNQDKLTIKTNGKVGLSNPDETTNNKINLTNNL